MLFAYVSKDSLAKKQEELLQSSSCFIRLKNSLEKYEKGKDHHIFNDSLSYYNRRQELVKIGLEDIHSL